MICISIQGKNKEEIFSILDRPEVEMAEIRLDRCPLDDEDIEEVFSLTDVPLIATCRFASTDARGRVGAEGHSPQGPVSCPSGPTRPLTGTEAEHRLAKAIEAGAQYVDLEIEAPPQVGKRLSRLAREAGTTFIRSFHDFEGTPSLETLRDIVSRCRRYGGGLVKIVTTARSEEDVRTVRDLYRDEEEGRLVAFCMGARGRESRLQ
jgi:3-dehydroquinate dehydratase-1